MEIQPTTDSRMSKIIKHGQAWFDVYFKGFLYFVIGYLGAYLPKAENFKTWSDFTSYQYLHIHLGAMLVGLLALRAYTDGSYQRKTDNVKQDNAKP